MATAITIQTAKTPFFVPTAGSLHFTWTAGDPTGMTFVCDGKELVLLWNSDGANPYTATIASVADEKGRTSDITNYSMIAGAFAHWTGGMTTAQGWMNATKIITITPSNAAVKLQS